jgi:hypothetical protein
VVLLVRPVRLTAFKTPTLASLPSFSSNSEFGEGIVLDVKLNGSMFSWTVKYSSPNYSRLHKRFGVSEKNWKGTVKVEVKEYRGKEYIAVT